MYKNILVPIDLDHLRDVGAAMDVARTLASEDATLTALNIIDEVPAHVAAYLPKDHGQTLIAEAETALMAELGGVANARPVVVGGHPGRTIVDYASDNEVDCIVISSHRPGLQDYFLGSTANRVVRHAPCSVHVVR